MARADARPLGSEPQRHGVASGRNGAEARLRCISEKLLGEDRRLYELGLSTRPVAESLLDQTSYASAHGAEAALRFQFTRRGWALRNRAQGCRARLAPARDDLARAA